MPAKQWNPLVISLLGGAIIPMKKCPGHWGTVQIDDFEPLIPHVGDALRVSAAETIYLRDYNGATGETTIPISIVVVGGRTPLHDHNQGTPLMSEVIVGELERHAIPREDIVRVDLPRVGGTYNQLLELARLLSRQRKVERVLILSNKWALPKIQALIHMSPKLRILSGLSFKPIVELVAAENTLVRCFGVEEFDDMLKALHSPKMRECLRAELEETRQIYSGHYPYRPKS